MFRPNNGQQITPKKRRTAKYAAISGLIGSILILLFGPDHTLSKVWDRVCRNNDGEPFTCEWESIPYDFSAIDWYQLPEKRTEPKSLDGVSPARE